MSQFTITEEDIKLLKKHGFQWYKDSCTDRVEAQYIKNIYPAACGFTVEYNSECVFRYSTAVVERIDYPDDLDTEWIRVHWQDVGDEKIDKN